MKPEFYFWAIVGASVGLVVLALLVTAVQGTLFPG